MKRKDLLSLNFYKKSPFTGSEKGIRYKIEKSEEEKLVAWIWPEPFAFNETEDALKTSRTFEFSENGLEEITSWINEVSRNHQS